VYTVDGDDVVAVARQSRRICAACAAVRDFFFGRSLGVVLAIATSISKSPSRPPTHHAMMPSALEPSRDRV
jgi:hypothetical protein